MGTYTLRGMGIGRDSRHKRRATGGKRPPYCKKRKHEMGRQMTMTKLGPKLIRTVRCRGANVKHRALKLESGNFSWGSEVCTKKTRLLDVVYNASNNELVRTKTLVKNAIVQIDATPFRQWYETHYGISLGKKRKTAKRQETRVIDPNIESQFDSNRLFAAISSRPGQSGRCDGYILEGRELDFYLKKMIKKK